MPKGGRYCCRGSRGRRRSAPGPDTRVAGREAPAQALLATATSCSVLQQRRQCIGSDGLVLEETRCKVLSKRQLAQVGAGARTVGARKSSAAELRSPLRHLRVRHNDLGQVGLHAAEVDDGLADAEALLLRHGGRAWPASNDVGAGLPPRGAQSLVVAKRTTRARVLCAFSPRARARATNWPPACVCCCARGTSL